MLKENMIGLTRTLVVLFAGTNILYTLGKGDKTLQTICSVALLVIALILSFTIWKQKDNKRIRYAVLQVLYCGITALIALGLSVFVGNVITSALIIAVTVLYVRFLLEKFEV